MIERARTATHEAGHCLVAMVLGLRFTHVTIDGDDPGVAWTDDPIDARQECSQVSAAVAAEYLRAGYLDVLFGGVAAEQALYGPLSLNSVVGASNDMHLATMLVTAACPYEARGDTLEDACERAEVIIAQRRPELDAIVAALEDRERLTYDEVEAVVRTSANLHPVGLET